MTKYVYDEILAGPEICSFEFKDKNYTLIETRLREV